MSLKRKTFTLSPAGADGSAVATRQWTTARPGFVRALSIDFQNQPATTDVVIKAENSSGRTLFTSTSSNTDIALTPVGMPGMDEAGAATAATDVSSGGFPFLNGLYIDVAQADGQTSGNEKIVVELVVEF